MKNRIIKRINKAQDRCAFVSAVNDDGTYDAYFPDSFDVSGENRTNLKNITSLKRTNFQVGDSVSIAFNWGSMFTPYIKDYSFGNARGSEGVSINMNPVPVPVLGYPPIDFVNPIGSLTGRIRVGRIFYAKYIGCKDFVGGHFPLYEHFVQLPGSSSHYHYVHITAIRIMSGATVLYSDGSSFSLFYGDTGWLSVRTPKGYDPSIYSILGNMTGSEVVKTNQSTFIKSAMDAGLTDDINIYLTDDISSYIETFDISGNDNDYMNSLASYSEDMADYFSNYW